MITGSIFVFEIIMIVLEIDFEHSNILLALSYAISISDGIFGILITAFNTEK